MAAYRTQQRKQLFSFLQNHPDRQFSAKQIAQQLSESGVSLSAVYRNLASLEREALVNRFTKEGSRELYYQYVQSEKCQNRMHLICMKCGRTLHMDATATDRLLNHVFQADGFQINKPKSVLFGLCRQCAEHHT